MYLYIFDSTGTQVYEGVDLEVIPTAYELQYINGECRLNLYEGSAIKTTEVWTPNVPEGNTLKGLSLTQGGTVLYPVGEYVLTEPSEADVNLYEIVAPIEPINVSVRDETGEILKGEVTGIQPVNHIKLTAVDNSATLTLISGMTTHTITWDVTIDFKGLSLSTDSQTNFIAVNTEKDVGLNSSTVFYEFLVLQPRPPIRVWMSSTSGSELIHKFVNIQPIKKIKTESVGGRVKLTLTDIFGETHQCEWVNQADWFAPDFTYDGIREGSPYPNGTLIATPNDEHDVNFTTDTVLFVSQKPLHERINVTVYDVTGTMELCKFTDVAYIRKVKLSTVSGECTITLTDGGGITHVNTFTVDDKFLGLSLSTGGGAYILPNDERFVEFTENTSLYAIEQPSNIISVTVKNADGSIQLGGSTTEQTITKLKLSKTGTNIKLDITSDIIRTIEWNITTAEAEVFQGLSVSVDGNMFIAVGEVKNTSINDSITLYELIGETDPNNTITLYQCTCEDMRVDKTAYLTEVGKLTGTFRDSFNIDEFDLTIPYDKIPDFNYVYINKLKRYYVLVDYNNVSTGIYKIHLKIDPLMSFKTGILNLNAFIDRNEFDFNSDIIDTERVYKQGYDIKEITIENDLFIDDPAKIDTDRFVLTGFDLEVVNGGTP